MNENNFLKSYNFFDYNFSEKEEENFQRYFRTIFYTSRPKRLAGTYRLQSIVEEKRKEFKKYKTKNFLSKEEFEIEKNYFLENYEEIESDDYFELESDFSIFNRKFNSYGYWSFNRFDCIFAKSTVNIYNKIHIKLNGKNLYILKNNRSSALILDESNNIKNGVYMLNTKDRYGISAEIGGERSVDLDNPYHHFKCYLRNLGHILNGFLKKIISFEKPEKIFIKMEYDKIEESMWYYNYDIGDYSNTGDYNDSDPEFTFECESW